MANTKFKADHGILSLGNSTFEQTVQINANLTVNSDLLLVVGNLHVTGNLNYTNTSLEGDMIPLITGADLGNTTNRFDLFCINVNSSGSINPVANAQLLGNTTKRWAGYFSTLDISGTTTIGGNVQIGTNTLLIDQTTNKLTVNAASPLFGQALTVQGDSSVIGTITSNNIVTKNLSCNGIITGKAYIYGRTTTVTTNAPIVVDTFSSANSRCVKYTTFSRDNLNNMITMDLNVMHDGTTLYISKSGFSVVGLEIGDYDAQFNGADVELRYTASNANSTNQHTVKAVKIQVLE